MSSLRVQMRYLNPYDLHKLIINEYVLKKPGDTKLLKRDNSKDRNDYDVIKENHKFLWDDSEAPKSWELQFAKKYYDKLFKEYCIGDLSLYKENKIALRWRTEKEVITGKGQFTCGNKKCETAEDLRTWEVNFAYVEQDQKKNALVKIRLCPDCSKKLNYHNRKKEIKRLQKKSVKQKHSKNIQDKDDNCHSASTSTDYSEENQKHIDEESNVKSNSLESPWENQIPVESKSREDEMEEYLQDLLL